METGPQDDAGMGRRPKLGRVFVQLYIGEWIARLGRKPVEVAKGAKIGESYLSTLISGERKNPGYTVLFAIADELGITVDDLRRNPPPRSTVEAVSRLSTKAQERLFDPPGDR